MGPVHRRPFHAKSCFSTKEKTFGVGFKLGSPSANQQCPGSERQPRPSWPIESRGLGEKMASVAFLSKGILGLLFAAQGEFNFPECSSKKLVWYH